MVKALGGLLVAGASLWGWYRQSAERRRRMDTLWALSTGLERMAEAIRLERTPLPRLLERLGREDRTGAAAAVFFRGLAQALGGGERAETAWLAAAEALPLCREDREALAEAAGALAGDEEQVCRALTAASARLRRSFEEARRVRPEREKRAAALWLSGGALLVILLI